MENSTYSFEIYDNYGVSGNTSKIRCHDGNLKNNKRQNELWTTTPISIMKNYDYFGGLKRIL